VKKQSNEEFQKQYPYPHCDSRVLHAPGDCEYCDHYPNRQQERVAQKVNFTNGRDPDKAPCPADAARGATVNQWHGNAPRPVLCKNCGHSKSSHQMNDSCMFLPNSKWEPRTKEEEEAAEREFYDKIVADVRAKRDAGK
jgi:ribosomal protein L32